MAKKPRRDPATANFHFPKKAKAQPNGFNDLNVKDEVTITVKGKIKSLSFDDNEEDWGGKDIRINITKIIIGQNDDAGTSFNP